MVTTVTRSLYFDYGHRVLKHESKCANLHGHRGRADITVKTRDEMLDDVGRVIDFGVVKQLVGAWIDDHWDHNILLNSEDPLAQLWSLGSPYRVEDIYQLFNSKPPFLFTKRNPTAENIAAALWEVSLALLPNPIQLVRVRVWETPNCYADYKG